MFENILTFNYKLIKKIKRKGIKQERERKYIVQKTKKKKNIVSCISIYTYFILSFKILCFDSFFFSCSSAEMSRYKKKKQ